MNSSSPVSGERSPVSPRPSPRTGIVIVAVHGILTGQTTASWVDRFQHYVWNHFQKITALKKEYRAGPLPVWNVFFKNRLLATALKNELVPFAEDGAEIAFICHSNGGDIVLKTIKQLAAAGHKTRAVVFTGAAIQADVRRSGILGLIERGELGRAVAYCSGNDLAVRFRIIWPYGHLGRTGFLHQGESCAHERIVTKWFPGYGHSGYFDGERWRRTFESAIHDCCFADAA